jgi:hypothetical protein
MIFAGFIGLKVGSNRGSCELDESPVPQKARNLFPDCANINFFRTTLLLGESYIYIQDWFLFYSWSV